MKKFQKSLNIALLCLFCCTASAQSDSSFVKIISVVVRGNQMNTPPQYITAFQSPTLDLPYDKNYLLFNFINTQNPAQKSFAYKLIGLDYEWMTCDSCSQVQYAHLDGGDYIFKVKSNEPNAIPTQLNITIGGEIWHKWWFVPMLFLYVLAIVGAGIYFFILFQFRQKLNEQRLIHTEKMASMAELTSGIAHEIQNPLNFVNNFSELSVDLAKELKEELEKSPLTPKGEIILTDKAYIDEILTDLTHNQEKIQHHGLRASNIVKGMLEHSSKSTGIKEPTDINALIKETLPLSMHNMKNKIKSFSEGLPIVNMDLDESIGQLNIVPQDMSRVLLNLFNNAFYAVHQHQQQLFEGLEPSKSLSTYTPSVSVTTKRENGKIKIIVKDNGNGIPENIRQKIFQPFFTTKPTGEGTGLGLSLAYDIVTKGHGGTLEVESTEGVGSVFILSLPFKTN